MPRAKKVLTILGRKIKLTIRQWAWVGAAVSGAGVLITGSVTILAYAAPIYDSDPAPYAGVKRVEELEKKTAQTFGEVQQSQMAISNQIKEARDETAFSLLQSYEPELEKATVDTRENPNSISAKKYRDDLIEKINKLRARLGLTLVVP